MKPWRLMGNVVQEGGNHITRIEVRAWEESCGKGKVREGVVLLITLVTRSREGPVERTKGWSLQGIQLTLT